MYGTLTSLHLKGYVNDCRRRQRISETAVSNLYYINLYTSRYPAWWLPHSPIRLSLIGTTAEWAIANIMEQTQCVSKMSLML